MKITKGKILLSVSSFFSAILSVELAMRVLKPQGWEYMTNAPITTDMFLPDHQVNHVLKPGNYKISTPEYSTTLRINSLGIRGAEIQEKRPDVYRILTIGDSFTLGVQVEEAASFQVQLSEKLTKVLKRPVEVINAGVDNFSTWEETILANRLDPVVLPDAWLMTFFLGNDLQDNMFYSPNLKEKPPIKNTFFDYLSKYSFMAYYFRIYTTPVSPHFKTEFSLYNDPSGIVAYMDFTKRAFLDFSESCQKARVDCFLAIAPQTWLVHLERAPATFKWVGVPLPENLDILLKEVKKNVPPNLHLIDLTPDLRKSAKSGEDLYLKFDDHWNANGHTVVAETLSQFIGKNLLEDPFEAKEPNTQN